MQKVYEKICISGLILIAILIAIHILNSLGGLL